jgi:hypothetical protein
MGIMRCAAGHSPGHVSSNQCHYHRFQIPGERQVIDSARTSWLRELLLRATSGCVFVIVLSDNLYDMSRHHTLFMTDAGTGSQGYPRCRTN